jgi:hypothetical protein
VRYFRTAAVLAAALWAAAPASAQSLADVARAEEARRATAKKAVKSFSNADLNPEDIAPPVAPAPPAAVAAGEKPANASPGAPDKPEAAVPAVENEEQWRRRADSIRSQLTKAQQEADAMAATAGDASRSPGERTQTARLLKQHQVMVANLERQWQRLETEAATAKIPRAWLGAAPILSTRTPQ